jgi:hypothetical protein
MILGEADLYGGFHPMPFPDMIAVVSSNVDAIGHDVENQELHVRFKGGSTYIYSPFSADEYASLALRSSIGRAINAEVKTTKACRKIDDPVQKDKNVFAWTETVQFPQYISINERGGRIEITVRAPEKPLDPEYNSLMACGETATMTIPRNILDELAKSVTEYLHPTVKKAPDKFDWEKEMEKPVPVKAILLPVRPKK